MAAPMSTPIQNLPTATVSVSKDEDNTLRDVLKEVELEISAAHPPQQAPPPMAPRIPPNAPVQPSTHAPIIYAMPTAPSACPVLKVGSMTFQPLLLKYAVATAVIALVVYAPATLQKIYQFVPMLSKFQSYEWVFKSLLIVVLAYAIFAYVF